MLFDDGRNQSQAAKPVPARVFYFGCYGEVGHYLHTPDMHHAWNDHNIIPWGKNIDSTLCPPGRYEENQPEGVAVLTFKDGWTALSFWDRSVDRRGNSNSNFIAEGAFNFNQMVEIAQTHFPKVWKRFKFPVVNSTEIEAKANK